MLEISSSHNLIKRRLLLGRKAMTNLDSILKSRDITLPTKVRTVKTMVFPLVMYRCESWTIKESWVPKNSGFRIVVLQKTLESSLDSKEIKSVNPKGNQSWIFIGRTDAEVEVPILWPPDVKSQLKWKRPWCWQKKKWAAEDEMVKWYHWLSGHEFEQPLGDSGVLVRIEYTTATT